MTKEIRYAVTVDFYIYAEDDADAKQQAKITAYNMDKDTDNKASVVSIHEAPFATMGKLREVK